MLYSVVMSLVDYWKHCATCGNLYVKKFYAVHLTEVASAGNISG